MKMKEESTSFLMKFYGGQIAIELEKKKKDLLFDIQQTGYPARLEPEHAHRIRMKELEYEEMKVLQGMLSLEKKQDDLLEIRKEQLANFMSWARFMKTTGTDKGPHFNRILIAYIKDKIAEMEGKIDSLSKAIDWLKSVKAMTVDELRQSISEDLLHSDIINSI
tara:strand:- start:220 stop:711 length:492 start_codon:yes stop_codon:yes gene_type:complete